MGTLGNLPPNIVLLPVISPWPPRAARTPPEQDSDAGHQRAAYPADKPLHLQDAERGEDAVDGDA